MAFPQFDDLPFNSRPDLTPYVIHLTKSTKAKDEHSAFQNLVNILKAGQIWPSTKKSGYIKGPNSATCFMDVPFQALKYVLTPDNMDPENPRYEPYGVLVKKNYAYGKGCRPVLYLSDKETKDLRIPDEELWRVVKFEVNEKGWISWLHEREWRCKGAFKLPREPLAVLVRNTIAADRLGRLIENDRTQFKCVPKSVIPLSVVCQGLLA